MKLDAREQELAVQALRHWEASIREGGPDEDVEIEAPTAEEIDRLCDKIGQGDPIVLIHTSGGVVTSVTGLGEDDYAYAVIDWDDMVDGDFRVIDSLSDEALKQLTKGEADQIKELRARQIQALKHLNKGQ